MANVIKNKSEYEAALVRIGFLVGNDPDVGTEEANELELLTVLVEEYEKREFHLWEPDPVEAIKFRMEQQNLSPRDLIPYIGSRSKVSEVLSGKRSLTLSMIKALHLNLGIPASVLIQDRTGTEFEQQNIDWNRFPLREMIKKGWIEESLKDCRSRAEEILMKFFSDLGSSKVLAALYRRSHHVRAVRGMDMYALSAWTARIMRRDREDPPQAKYDQRAITQEFMREVARLSWSEKGPLLAIEFLRKHGINVIVECHLPRTHLDGAAILTNTNHPIIGLTLRHDRIDNFWFCLMHELCHVALHLNTSKPGFFDDLDTEGKEDPIEAEADLMASEVLIPKEEWEISPASKLRSVEAVEHLANKLRIHPAIVAGRIRREFNSYRVLSQMVGHRQVRVLFKDVKWG